MTASPPASHSISTRLPPLEVAAGVDGIFLEVHEDPSKAKSDAQNALRLDQLEPLLRRLMAIDAIVKAVPGQESKTLAPTASDRRGR